MYLKKAGGIADIVANEALRGDSNLVLMDGGLRPRLLHSLVSIHGCRAAVRPLSPSAVQACPLPPPPAVCCLPPAAGESLSSVTIFSRSRCDEKEIWWKDKKSATERRTHCNKEEARRRGYSKKKAHRPRG
ncbi:hypothetical protein KSP40_PGU009918 [Platanthera guangdongensis]|uniref:Uncharacterized protein n=1 Tax=Platanthera guangdongensis TaxID=2320717 RepID=A0ABR2M494_9ASPA